MENNERLSIGSQFEKRVCVRHLPFKDELRPALSNLDPEESDQQKAPRTPFSERPVRQQRIIDVSNGINVEHSEIFSEDGTLGGK